MQVKMRPVLASRGEIDRTLVAYTLVGGVASLLPVAADGAVIYSGVQNISFARPATTGSSMGVDLDGDTNDDISLAWTKLVGWTAHVYGFGSGMVLMNVSNFMPTVMAPGTSIDAGLDSKPNLYKGSLGASAAEYDGTDSLVSSFSGSSSGLVAFRLHDAGDYRYGWMRLQVPASAPSGANFTLVDWAYESTVNTAIAAGDTGASAIPLPGAAALAALAMGSGGLRDWRRRKRVA